MNCLPVGKRDVTHPRHGVKESCQKTEGKQKRGKEDLALTRRKKRPFVIVFLTTKKGEMGDQWLFFLKVKVVPFNFKGRGDGGKKRGKKNLFTLIVHRGGGRDSTTNN